MIREELEPIVQIMVAMSDGATVVRTVCSILRDMGKRDAMIEGLVEVLGEESRRLEQEKMEG